MCSALPVDFAGSVLCLCLTISILQFDQHQAAGSRSTTANGPQRRPQPLYLVVDPCRRFVSASTHPQISYQSKQMRPLRLETKSALSIQIQGRGTGFGAETGLGAV